MHHLCEIESSLPVHTICKLLKKSGVSRGPASLRVVYRRGEGGLIPGLNKFKFETRFTRLFLTKEEYKKVSSLAKITPDFYIWKVGFGNVPKGHTSSLHLQVDPSVDATTALETISDYVLRNGEIYGIVGKGDFHISMPLSKREGRGEHRGFAFIDFRNGTSLRAIFYMKEILNDAPIWEDFEGRCSWKRVAKDGHKD